ncbi:MAG: ABC transporter ATP-binding protein [Defluviitaleaceae bacterium]|nr:ABC transporter ATP-binding protein [Defluviitaleaceae bacterium]MCL2276162.1 ABC transporter ATP-binding protein [Defluviitaleaceae bacterium]
MSILAKVENLRVQYGSNVAVNDISFEISAGEIVAVIGSNGCGKTSAMECLGGLRNPGGGAVAVFGKDPRNERKEIYHELGVQLQESAYPEKIKVGEICDWFSSFYENPVAYEKLLAQFGLADKAKSYVSKLSGGQRQRLSILLAMLGRPKLLILDELTTGLDPEARRGIWEILKVIKSGGIGVLLVSHYMDEVENLADRIIFMQSGKIFFTGTLGELQSFAQENLPAEKWNADMRLEDIYLAFAPEQKAIALGELL